MEKLRRHWHNRNTNPKFSLGFLLHVGFAEHIGENMVAPSYMGTYVVIQGRCGWTTIFLLVRCHTWGTFTKPGHH